MMAVKTTIKCNSESEFIIIAQYIEQSAYPITIKGKKCGFLNRVEEWHRNPFHQNIIELTVSGAITDDIVKMMNTDRQKISFEIEEME